MCGVLTLAELQMSTKPVLLPPSLAGQGRNNITKSAWTKARTGKDHSPVAIMDETDSAHVNSWIVY